MKHSPTRKLSFARVILAICILAATIYGSLAGWQWWKQSQLTATYKPWFAAYVDVTSTPTYAFEQLGTTTTPDVVLSFIVSSPTDPCTPTWGSAYTLTEASTNLDLDRRIARLQQLGGKIAISFGGALNDELAVKCTDPDKLLHAYEAVVDRYSVDTIDLDIESTGLTNVDALKRRADAIAKLQDKKRSNGKSLSVWLTIPVTPHGLIESGTRAVSETLQGGVDLSGVNIMTMDYATGLSGNKSMSSASKQALNETHRQLGVLYKQVGIHLNSASLWKKIGATPMIGQNDVVEEVFTLEDAKELNLFARDKGIGRMSMWSANRDISCGENYVDLQVVSDSCSGVKAEAVAFAKALGEGFHGNLTQNATIVTKEDKDAKTQLPDDPTKSPYQIWQENGAYPQGVKVVWHHNVYEAKWWTKGDLPDNPVLQSWETPWQLMGPVLPGEKPIPQAKLPPGTYPEWSGTETYQAGDRVLLSGIPFQAKWWNQGDSPAASAANSDNSPWLPLSQAQIKEILK